MELRDDGCLICGRAIHIFCCSLVKESAEGDEHRRGICRACFKSSHPNHKRQIQQIQAHNATFLGLDSNTSITTTTTTYTTSQSPKQKKNAKPKPPFTTLVTRSVTQNVDHVDNFLHATELPTDISEYNIIISNFKDWSDYKLHDKVIHFTITAVNSTTPKQYKHLRHQLNFLNSPFLIQVWSAEDDPRFAEVLEKLIRMIPSFILIFYRSITKLDQVS